MVIKRTDVVVIIYHFANLYLRHSHLLLNDMNPEDFFTFANSNAYKLLPIATAVLLCAKVFFAERVVKPWNCIPAELHHFSSLSVFKSSVFST